MARRKHKRPHGTGSVRIRGGRAQLQWTEGGQRRTKTVDLAEYQAFLTRACAGLEVLPPEPAPTGKLADLAETWLAGRSEMASNSDDRNRWRNHLLPAVGHLAPDQVDVPVVKRLIVDLRQKGLGKGTVRLCMALLSSFYGDLVEDGVAKLNPVKMLSPKTRMNELKSDWDWKKTPFLQDPNDVRRIYLVLCGCNEYPLARAFVVGALAGLRTNEVRALGWEHIDFVRRIIHVKEQVRRFGGGTKILKDGESRFVPMSNSLAAILEPDVSTGLVCSDNGKFLDLHRMGYAIKKVLAGLELPAMRWYDATRHTFGSQWVLSGGSLETLREMMGHSSVTMTERYAHLIPGNYSDADRARVVVEVERPAVRELN